jgi:hypothetical protein
MSINYATADPWSSGIRINKRGATGNANAAIANGTELGYHGFYGWNGSAFGRSAMVYAAAEQNFSAGNHGGRLAFYTTPVGANDVSERMRITPSGQVSIGRTDPPAHQTLNVSAPDHAVISVEDINNGVGYLAQAGNVTLLGAEAEFRIRNGTNYGSGPIASGTDRMIINTSGHVTTPFQPRFQMVRSYDGNGANWPNGTFFTYVHKPIDVGSNANTSTGRFTAPVAGYYQFGFMTAHKTAVPLGDMMFLKNGGGDEAATGVAVFNQTGNGVSNEWITQTMTTVMYLAANDYVTVNNTCCWGGKPSEFRYIFNGYLLG